MYVILERGIVTDKQYKRVVRLVKNYFTQQMQNALSNAFLTTQELMVA